MVLASLLPSTGRAYLEASYQPLLIGPSVPSPPLTMLLNCAVLSISPLHDLEHSHTCRRLLHTLRILEWLLTAQIAWATSVSQCNISVCALHSSTGIAVMQLADGYIID